MNTTPLVAENSNPDTLLQHGSYAAEMKTMLERKKTQFLHWQEMITISLQTIDTCLVALANTEPISFAEYRRLSKEVANDTEDLILAITRAYCITLNDTVENVFRRFRNTDLVAKRQAIIYMLYTAHKFTLMSIAKSLGYDNATIIHARNRAKELLEIKDPIITKLISKLKANHEQPAQ